MEVVECQCDHRRSSHKQRFVLIPNTETIRLSIRKPCDDRFNAMTDYGNLVGYLEIPDSDPQYGIYHYYGSPRCCSGGYSCWYLFKQDILDLNGTISDDGKSATLPNQLLCAVDSPCTWCVYTCKKPAPVMTPISETVLPEPKPEPTTIVTQTVGSDIERRSSDKQRFVKDTTITNLYKLVLYDLDFDWDPNSKRRLREYLQISEPKMPKMFRKAYETPCCSGGTAAWFLYRQDVLDLGGTVSDDGNTATVSFALVCAPEHPCTWCVYSEKHPAPKIDTEIKPPVTASEPEVKPPVAILAQVFDFDPITPPMKFRHVDVWDAYHYNHSYNRKVLKYFGVTSAHDSYKIWRHDAMNDHTVWHLLDETILFYRGTIDGEQATVPRSFECNSINPCTRCIFEQPIDKIQSVRVFVTKPEVQTQPVVSEQLAQTEVQSSNTETPSSDNKLKTLQCFDFGLSGPGKEMTFRLIDVWKIYGGDNIYDQKVRKYFGVTSPSDSYKFWYCCPITHGHWHLLEEVLLAYGGVILNNTATLSGHFECNDTNRCTGCIFTKSSIDEIQPLCVAIPKPKPIQVFDFASDQLTSSETMTLQKVDIWSGYNMNWPYANKLRKYFSVTSAKDSFSIWQYAPKNMHGVWDLLEEDVIAYGGRFDGRHAIIKGRFTCTSAHPCINCMFDNYTVRAIPILKSSMNLVASTKLNTITEPQTLGQTVPEQLAQPKVQTPPDKYAYEIPHPHAKPKPESTPITLKTKRVSEFDCWIRFKVRRSNNNQNENVEYRTKIDGDSCDMSDAIQSIRDKLDEIEQNYC